MLTTKPKEHILQDSYQRAKNDGIILRKYWLATYDKRARDWHKDAGNDYTEEKAIEIDDFFIVDGEKMLHPGDSMHGRRVLSLDRLYG